METRANYLLVGGFVLVFMIGLLGFVVWLAKFQFDTQYARYNVVFSRSVTGLGLGSAVRYNGVNVGEVIDIRLDRERANQVRATIEVIADTPIRENTVATLELQGLTGGLYVLLTGEPEASPPLKPKPGEKYAVIRAGVSSLEQVLSGAPELLEGATLLLARGNALLNDDNRARIGEILQNVSRLTETLAGQAAEIETVFGEAAETMRNLRQTSAAVEGLAATFEADSKGLFQQANKTLVAAEKLAGSLGGSAAAAQQDVNLLSADLSKSANAVTAMANEIRGTVAENREPIGDFAATGLFELTTLITEARDFLTGLNRVTTEVQRDPARFLFGNQQQGYEPGKATR